MEPALRVDPLCRNFRGFSNCLYTVEPRLLALSSINSNCLPISRLIFEWLYATTRQYNIIPIAPAMNSLINEIGSCMTKTDRAKIGSMIKLQNGYSKLHLIITPRPCSATTPLHRTAVRKNLFSGRYRKIENWLPTFLPTKMLSDCPM